MSLNKPFRRTSRPFTNDSYSNDYIRHQDFSQNPQHYIRAFLLLQKDLIELFDYIEPCEGNLKTVSYRIHELLIRTCVEIEANFTAILRENQYSKKGNLKMEDFLLINQTHHLSAYKASVPFWKGESKIRCPFDNWIRKEPLEWFQIYNKLKHERYDYYDKANFNNLVDAMCGLAIVISSQFNNETFSPRKIWAGIGYVKYLGDGMEDCIGDYFRILYPNDWSVNERYDFNWAELEKTESPIDRINYNEIQKKVFPADKKNAKRNFKQV
jgi:hypothetical protein